MKIEVKVPEAPSKKNVKFPVLAQAPDGAIFLFFSRTHAVNCFGSFYTDLYLDDEHWVLLPLGSQITFTHDE